MIRYRRASLAGLIMGWLPMPCAVLDGMAERPAQRTGATRRGPRPPGSIVRGEHEQARQADTSRGYVHAERLVPGVRNASRAR
jgi:hypothetical protein